MPIPDFTPVFCALCQTTAPKFVMDNSRLHQCLLLTDEERADKYLSLNLTAKAVDDDLPPLITHDFIGVAEHPDDDECTHREDGTDATYCGATESAHGPQLDPTPWFTPETGHRDEVEWDGTLGGRDFKPRAQFVQTREEYGEDEVPDIDPGNGFSGMSVNGKPLTWKERVEHEQKQKFLLQEAARFMSDLDRSPSGRHQGDGEYQDPTGISQGNPHLKVGQIIGYSMRGKPYIVPEAPFRGNLRSWGG